MDKKPKWLTYILWLVPLLAGIGGFAGGLWAGGKAVGKYDERLFNVETRLSETQSQIKEVQAELVKHELDNMQILTQLTAAAQRWEKAADRMEKLYEKKGGSYGFNSGNQRP